MTDPIRLSKRMSELGLCSRREADEWIAKGWVRRDELRFVTATDQANEELRDLTAATLRYLREMESALAACGND